MGLHFGVISNAPKSAFVERSANLPLQFFANVDTSKPRKSYLVRLRQIYG